MLRGRNVAGDRSRYPWQAGIAGAADRLNPAPSPSVEGALPGSEKRVLAKYYLVQGPWQTVMAVRFPSSHWRA